MLLIETGQQSLQAFDAKLVFARFLASIGYDVCIDPRSVPQDLDRPLRYEAAPFVRQAAPDQIETIIVIGGHDIDAPTQQLLRTHITNDDTKIIILGQFASLQSEITAQTKIAYALSHEPKLVNMTTLYPRPLVTPTITPLVLNMSKNATKLSLKPHIVIYIPAEWVEDPLTLPALDLLNADDRFSISIIVPNAVKRSLLTTSHRGIQAFGYAEIAPHDLMNLADIAVFFGDRLYGERMASFAMHMMQAGKLTVDCTADFTISKTGAPVLRGPQSLTALPTYLTHSIIENYAELSQAVKDNPWLAEQDFNRVEQIAGLSRPVSTPHRETNKRVFFPTNGNGLGHAQRCLLVAEELTDTKATNFVAFPSCTTLIRSKGYDVLPLVQKSDVHVEPYANDLLNAVRMGGFVDTGDHLVFDGGYVFDSVLRCIFAKQLRATWIRRGLWQASQVTPEAIAREKAFSQIIVPQEAFDELNQPSAFLSKTAPVGPIVRLDPVDETEKTAIRERLKARFDRDFDKLTLTMLGGGVAADRSAQIQTIASMMDRRSDCLNLILVWPNASVSPSICGWRNSRVISSQNAVRLAQAADLTISAAGYNSFHEILYHKVPAIFIPQMAPYMDDQTKRARAASERGLADSFEANELLQLIAAISHHLDNDVGSDVGKALAEITLPDIGNTQAARLLEGHVL